MYRLTPAGLEAAAGSTGETRRVLAAVWAARDPELDGWSEEEGVLDAGAPVANQIWTARSILKRHVTRGLLERRRTRERGQVSLVTLTAEGADLLQREARLRGRRLGRPTRPPRLDCSVHHLLVVEASIEELVARDARFVRLVGDEDLRSQSRRGRMLEAGMRDEALADGRLTMREPGQPGTTWLDIEILISKYTDEKIREKYATLDPSTTVYYSPTERLCRRVLGLVGERPVLLGD